ncbi:DUF3141 domain-containing protein [Donghicola mangrovi]
MVSVYELFNAAGTLQPAQAQRDVFDKVNGGLHQGMAELSANAETGKIQSAALERHSRRMLAEHSERARHQLEDLLALVEKMGAVSAPTGMAEQWAEYVRDCSERAILAADILRKRADIFLEHEAAGCPPVLVYDYELVMDGADLPHPSNYMLLKITPPEGVEVHDWKRPYIIIDPRAGHGPGIGGFKSDSQVGVALAGGHPVYFVAFRREPAEGQYLSFVTRSEAAFVREVMRRHPDAAKPIITGNCQGGWATLLLAATNPDLTGPIVINGAPVATWSGKVGDNPMRYNAGVLGGTWVPMFLSDLGGGLFDGAHLVQNFELLNPSRTLFRKYTDLFRDADTAEPAFLEFERWWGGFFLLNEPEIHWIVEQLFVGNRLVKNEARIEPGRPVDLKAIRAPIIVFASHGDNITPPQQALNWIVQTYADEQEIRIRGQRIIYMVHEKVGHLGIFVSSKIAKREHTEVASTLKTIEALAPGLYEMTIDDIVEEDGETHFVVGFSERQMADIRSLSEDMQDERPFAAVARNSEVQAQLYDALVRPFMKAAITKSAAEASRVLHPQRLSRAMMASRNPLVAPIEALAGHVVENRAKADPANPFLAAEAFWVQGVEQAIDMWRDTRDMMTEMSFYALWSNPWGRNFGSTHETRRTLKNPQELRNLPEVTQALFNMRRGGFAEAVIRMLILLAENRGAVRRDRLERASRLLTKDEPFKSLGAERRAMIIQEQTLIVTYEPEEAIASLPDLLTTQPERETALLVVRFVPGAISEMSPQTLHLLERFHKVLGQPEFTSDVTEDPLAIA